MNTTLETRPSQHNHPPSAVEQREPVDAFERFEPRPVRRVGLADRVALRVGVALVTWSRRPLRLETRERRANRVEQHLARLAREHAAERALRLTTPVR
jgi:hypothetical protein